MRESVSVWECVFVCGKVRSESESVCVWARMSDIEKFIGRHLSMSDIHKEFL